MAKRDVRGLRVVVTGASSGLGAALAQSFAKAGAQVALVARSADRLQPIAYQIAELGVPPLVIPTDLTSAAERESLFERLDRDWDGLDVLVNNAGVAAHGHFVDLTPEILRHIFEVNFFALAECCRLAIPRLANGRTPAIVNISSMTGRRGVPGWTDYGASKFAVSGFSESLRAELERFQIHVMLVIPGLIKTGLGENLLARLGRLPARFDRGLPPDAVAERIVRGLRRNTNELWIERESKLLLWLNWLAPWYINRAMARLVHRLYLDEITGKRPDPVVAQHRARVRQFQFGSGSPIITE